MARRSTTESSDGSNDRFIEEVATEVDEAKLPSVYNVYGHTESHQFDQNESEVWWHHQLQRYCSMHLYVAEFLSKT